MLQQVSTQNSEVRMQHTFDTESSDSMMSSFTSTDSLFHASPRRWWILTMLSICAMQQASYVSLYQCMLHLEITNNTVLSNQT